MDQGPHSSQNIQGPTGKRLPRSTSFHYCHKDNVGSMSTQNQPHLDYLAKEYKLNIGNSKGTMLARHFFLASSVNGQKWRGICKGSNSSGNPANCHQIWPLNSASRVLQTSQPSSAKAQQGLCASQGSTLVPGSAVKQREEGASCSINVSSSTAGAADQL